MNAARLEPLANLAANLIPALFGGRGADAAKPQAGSGFWFFLDGYLSDADGCQSKGSPGPRAKGEQQSKKGSADLSYPVALPVRMDPRPAPGWDLADGLAKDSVPASDPASVGAQDVPSVPSSSPQSSAGVLSSNPDVSATPNCAGTQEGCPAPLVPSELAFVARLLTPEPAAESASIPAPASAHPAATPSLEPLGTKPTTPLQAVGAGTPNRPDANPAPLNPDSPALAVVFPEKAPSADTQPEERDRMTDPPARLTDSGQPAAGRAVAQKAEAPVAAQTGTSKEAENDHSGSSESRQQSHPPAEGNAVPPASQTAAGGVTHDIAPEAESTAASMPAVMATTVSQEPPSTTPPAPQAGSPHLAEAELSEPPAQPVSRDVSLHLGDGQTNVDIRMAERGGEIRVTVQTSDHDLANSMRGDLPDLVGKLRQAGYQAEAWRPAGAQTEDHHGASNGWSAQQQFSGGRKDNRQPGQQQQQQSKQKSRRAGEWRSSLASAQESS